MAYQLSFAPEAQDDLQKIDKTQAKRIIKKMQWVADNATEVQHEALTGQWLGYYRWHIGKYRAIYLLDTEGQLILVAVIGLRKEVYDG